MSTTKSPVHSSGSKTPRDLEAARSAESQTAEELYPNYNTTIIWITIQLTACIFLFLLWAPNPSKNTAIIAAGDEYVGAFKKCSGTVCDDWLKGSGAEATPPDTKPPDRRDILKRAGSLADAITPSSFYLNTGLALLSAFYFSLYITIFLIIRWFKIPQLSEPDPVTANPDDKPPKKKWEERRKIKVFAYNASRSLGFLNVAMIFGCLVASGIAVWNVRNKMELKGSDGIGGGFFLLLFALLLSFYSALRDLTSPGGKAQKWLTLRSCCPNKILCFTRKPLLPTTKKEEMEMKPSKRGSVRSSREGSPGLKANNIPKQSKVRTARRPTGNYV